MNYHFTKSKDHIAQDGKSQIISEGNSGALKTSRMQTKLFEGFLPGPRNGYNQKN